MKQKKELFFVATLTAVVAVLLSVMGTNVTNEG
jgi:hypothetical protein